MVIRTGETWLGPTGNGVGAEFSMQAEKGSRPTVFAVDDDVAMRELVARMLEPLDVGVRMFDSAEAYIIAHDQRHAGCLLLDMKLPGMDGMSLLHILTSRGSTLPVIFLTGYGDVGSARQALISGATDFLQKPVDRGTLLDSVRRALEIDRERRRSWAVASRLTHLTPREWEVMRLVVAGQANKVIGANLGISQKTVEAHRARVMAKTCADSVADLVRMFSALETMSGDPRAGRRDADIVWRRAQ